jgi:hypothetical protein
MNYSKLTDMFKQKSAATLVEEDLLSYEKLLLEHEHAMAYHKQMVDYYRNGLKRLQTYAENGVK